MRDILARLEEWRRHGEQIAIATVTKTWGSAPRQTGAKMAVTLSGHVVGSVSAGCVEGAVIEEALAVLASGTPCPLQYGVSDEEAFDVGLACGGTIEIFVEPFTAFEEVYGLITECLGSRQPLGIVSLLDGDHFRHKLAVLADGHTVGEVPLPGRQAQIVRAAAAQVTRDTSGFVKIDGVSLFVDVYPRTPRLVIVGAVHIAEILAPMADLAGFEVCLVDPRSAFATHERFPHVAQIINEWPDQALALLSLDDATYIAALTHDPKLDDPALLAALASQARYIGALGSRRTNQLRLERLRQAGLTDAQLARLHAPIGLPLGGRSPAEIAVSILAEIVKAKSKAIE
jgi:xanthine dehydrogenase accessory factor